MSSEGSATPTAPKSKRERIRDNQRRSRARRQEYLAELEARLKESYDVCREAELQRAAFADLQAENARLRELLNSAGIGPDIVETFKRQRMQPCRPLQDDAAVPSHRQIKPKFQPTVAFRQSHTLGSINQESNKGTCYPTPTSSSSLSTSLSALPTDSVQFHDGQYRSTFLDAANIDERVPFSHFTMSPVPSFDWMLGSEGECGTASDDVSFCCDSFHVPLNRPHLPDHGNTVQCSVAKAMNEQYNLPPSEMEEIEGRFAVAFSRPTFP